METKSGVIVQETSVEEAKKAAAKVKKREVFLKRMADGRAAKKKKPMVAAAFSETEPKQVKTEPVKLSSEIKWFTEIDLNDKGKVAVDYPAYYFEPRMKELKEEIRQLEEGIDEGVYQGKRLRDARNNLKTMKYKMEKIEEGRPKLSDVDKDKVARSFNDFQKSIKESLFTYDECWKQTADPHEEAKRMESPCIKITDDIVGSYARQRGFKIEDGKISRNQATVIAKVMSKVLGERCELEYKSR